MDQGESAEHQQEKLDEFKKSMMDQMADMGKPGFSIHWSIYLIGFIVFFTVVGFFGYKLFQSLTEKERKREEKKRLKEMKKKK